MNRLRVFTLFFVALIFVAVPSALAGEITAVNTNSTSQMAEGPVPWPGPGFDTPVPWPGPGFDTPVPWPGVQKVKG